MKFEKTPGQSAPTGLAAEQSEAANRWSERKAKIDRERFGPRIDPVMRARVADLFRGLLRDIAAGQAKIPRAKWQREPAPRLTLEELAGQYAINPVKLSAEALESPRKKL